MFFRTKTSGPHSYLLRPPATTGPSGAAAADRCLQTSNLRWAATTSRRPRRKPKREEATEHGSGKTPRQYGVAEAVELRPNPIALVILGLHTLQPHLDRPQGVPRSEMPFDLANRIQGA